MAKQCWAKKYDEPMVVFDPPCGDQGFTHYIEKARLDMIKTLSIDALLLMPCMTDEISEGPKLDKKHVHSPKCVRCNTIETLRSGQE